MQEDKLAYWIWIVMVMGFANKDTYPLVQKYPDAEELYYLMCQPDCRFLSERQKKHAVQNSLEKAKSILDTCRKKEMQVLTCQDADYPDRLRHVYGPPAVLFCKGNPAVLRQQNLLTVVGTRHPSEYSIRTARQLCHELACAEARSVWILSCISARWTNISRQSACADAVSTATIRKALSP